jgi:V-type H+-transporting ATPase subunit a
VGVDPAWHIASNDLLFFNSLKMKVSVILGIIQMSFGIILRGINAIFFESMLDFFTGASAECFELLAV